MTTAYTPFFPTESETGDDPFHFEKALKKQGFIFVGGVDEAGRGPLAGPVVAACVVLPVEPESDVYVDSKQLSASRREYLYSHLKKNNVPLGIGVADARDIEQMNILQASLYAMKKAVLECNKQINDGQVDFLLVDGKFTVPLPLEQHALVKGESRSRSIAAASIVAKVTRDRMMANYHEQYPQYNFIKNQGYPTAEHREAIRKFGPCQIHRKTFKGVREFCVQKSGESTVRQQSIWKS